MDFSLSDEQQLLLDSIGRFLRNEYDFETRRRLAATPLGWDEGNWRTIAEMGLTALLVPEEYGGIGGNAADMALVIEQFGRHLVLEPYLPTAVLGAVALSRGGSEAAKQDLLPKIAEGALKIAFAHQEPRGRHARTFVATRAERAGDGWRISGHKAVVRNAATADKILVSARTGGGERDANGISLFLIDADGDGVSRRDYQTVDGGRASEVTLDKAEAAADALIGEAGGGYALLDLLLDYGAAAVSAEGVGAMQGLHDLTLEYLRTREQFGTPIGRFQVLQHRMVDIMMELEQSRSIAYAAALSLAEEPNAARRARAVSAAKAKIAEAGRQVGEASVQMHGGIAMTEEYGAGHYFKRLTMIADAFGDAPHHLARFSALARSAA